MHSRTARTHGHGRARAHMQSHARTRANNRHKSSTPKHAHGQTRSHEYAREHARTRPPARTHARTALIRYVPPTRQLHTRKGVKTIYECFAVPTVFPNKGSWVPAPSPQYTHRAWPARGTPRPATHSPGQPGRTAPCRFGLVPAAAALRPAIRLRLRALGERSQVR